MFRNFVCMSAIDIFPVITPICQDISRLHPDPLHIDFGTYVTAKF